MIKLTIGQGPQKKKRHMKTIKINKKECELIFCKHDYTLFRDFGNTSSILIPQKICQLWNLAKKNSKIQKSSGGCVCGIFCVAKNFVAFFQVEICTAGERKHKKTPQKTQAKVLCTGKSGSKCGIFLSPFFSLWQKSKEQWGK